MSSRVILKKVWSGPEEVLELVFQGKAPHLSQVWVCPTISPAFFSWLQEVRPQLETTVSPKLQQLGSSVHMLLGQKIDPVESIYNQKVVK